ncbi:MAG: CoA transferase, partial [Pseudomonadota bacterium]|nr:CoA transferase [Pseudomonadota bacterium]
SIPADGSTAGVAIDTRVALLPLTLDGQHLPLRRHPPALGADSVALLQEIGYGVAQIEALCAAGVVGVSTPLD